ncbi:hypothetical protein P152DRAFT_463006 [Eremomyces bilateralis CBS 781.70]|uniref:RNI-like protein n=1 Tax=Eremomyces bilateralis CBS 781.70 TaxID=1392243 RepID=A0A6G1FQE3_9PEZI|nr:uncharacterized protein P152DRAFT_463006 [Eremomyces bilateralis CBS 781.70]KAF1807948.1 hypothetical protein P152DRAFT_463006 [Eremomyces bilateralis CBS 781.70]
MDEEADLPSYDDARQPDIWPFVLPYLHTSDLLSLGQASRQLSGRVQGFLWFAPRRFWPRDSEDAFVVFGEFLQILRSTNHHPERNPGYYTRVLDLSNFKRETFSLPMPRDWLSIVLSSLPNLRCLIVAHSAIFDSDSINGRVPHHGKLRLLDASYCPNLTFDALSRFLQRVPDLAYLDVSGNRTPDVDKSSLWAQLRRPSLRILQLRQMSITLQLDQALDGNGSLRSYYHCLDLRDSDVGDAFVGSLIGIPGNPTLEPPPPYTYHLPTPLHIGSHLDFGDDTVDIPRFIESKIRGRLENPIFKHDLVSMVSIFRNIRLENTWSSIADYHGLTHIDVSGTRVSLKQCAGLLDALPLQSFGCGRHSSSKRVQNQYGKPDFGIRAILQDIKDSKGIASSLKRCSTLRDLRCPHYVVTGFSSAWDSAPGLEREDRYTASETIERDRLFLTPPHTSHPPAPSTTGFGQPSHMSSGSPSTVPHEGIQWQQNLTPDNQHRTFSFDAALVSLERLVLTDLPSQSTRGHVSSCLKAFLQTAGDWVRISRQYQEIQVSAEPCHYQTSTIHHPSEAIPNALASRQPRSSLGDRQKPRIVDVSLQSLKLEMSSDREEHRRMDRRARNHDESMENDESINSFDQLIKDDFSFFSNERVSSGFQESPLHTVWKSKVLIEEHPDFDVAKSLAEFRRRSKARPGHQDVQNTEVDGIWCGSLTIEKYSVS